MSRPRNKDNQHIKLAIARPIYDRLQSELTFLGINSTIVQVENREIRSRAEFIRTITGNYAQRFLDNFIEPRDFDDGAVWCSFYLDRRSNGLWNVAVNGGAACNQHHLVNCALADYFDRQDAIAASLQEQIARVSESLKVGDWATIKGLVYAY